MTNSDSPPSTIIPLLSLDFIRQFPFAAFGFYVGGAVLATVIIATVVFGA